MLAGMGDASLTTDLGRVMVTGGSGFVGCNLVAELLDRGCRVRSFDRVPSALAEHPRLETVQGDICDADAVAAAVGGIDTVFHTAALIELMGGRAVTDEYVWFSSTSSPLVMESPSTNTRSPPGGIGATSGPRRPSELIRTRVRNVIG